VALVVVALGIPLLLRLVRLVTRQAPLQVREILVVITQLLRLDMVQEVEVVRQTLVEMELAPHQETVVTELHPLFLA
jgi:hypothetical protein